MKVKCPVCKKEVEFEGNPNRPFCSERCKLIDLGEWASGSYAVPGDHDPTAEEDSSKSPTTNKKDFED